MIKAGIVMDDNMSNLTSASNDASISSGNINEIGSVYPQQPLPSSPTNQSQLAAKKKRNLPGNPDPEAEVIAMSPRTLLATNRFICEICNKGFQREQNLQLHRRGHNLPWKLKQRTDKEVIRKKVYVCPETTCVHHDPSRALGDLTGIKKHFSRKHGEKKWKCEKCSKRYAVQTDWKAHSKICGTREYRCDCGTLFSRRDSFITHRAFCDVLAEESARSFTSNPLLSSQSANQLNLQSEFHGGHGLPIFPFKREQDLQQSLINLRPEMPPWLVETGHNPGTGHHDLFSSSPRIDQSMIQHENHNSNPNITLSSSAESPHMSATALLQKAAQMGVTMSSQPCQSVAEMTTTLRPHKAHMRTTAAAATGIAGIMSSTSLATSTAGSNLGLSSREEMRTKPTFIHHGSAYFGNITSGCMEQVGATDDHHGTFMGMMSSLPPSTSDNHGIQGAPFGENFHGILNSKRDNEINFQERNQKPDGSKDGGVVGSLGGNVGLTRDFLGLKAFPHREFLNLDDLHQIGGSSYDHQHLQNQNPAPWQS